MRGVRIFDITDIKKPKLVANVQTCRGSHTHTVLEDPKDTDNVYIYVSGSSGVRSPNELAGLRRRRRRQRPELVAPAHRDHQGAARRSGQGGGRRPRQHLRRPDGAPTPRPVGRRQGRSGDAGCRRAPAARSSAKNPQSGTEMVVPPQLVAPMLDSIVKARGGTGAATRADTAAARPRRCRRAVNRMFGAARHRAPAAPISERSQCHDITVYPALGLAGGACEGHGLLLDISDPVNPVRLDAVADSNFAYWHSATFNNDGTQDAVLRRVGRRRRAEVPRRRQAGVGRQRDLHDREPQAEVPELLQDPDVPDVERELRGAQRLADPDPGSRRDGAGVVSGRHLGVRLDRRRRTRRRSPSSTAARSTRRAW